jgi:hypothetical protein
LVGIFCGRPPKQKVLTGLADSVKIVKIVMHAKIETGVLKRKPNNEKDKKLEMKMQILVLIQK